MQYSPVRAAYYGVRRDRSVEAPRLAPGVYRGRGDGLESGPFVARIKVTSVVRGNAITLDYEAVSDSKGLQHVEHTILTASEAGRLELHVTCLELPGVTRFVETRVRASSTRTRGPCRRRSS